MKRIFVSLMTLLLLLLAASAFADTMPMEVSQHIGKHFSGYKVFDYIGVDGTGKGDFGIALLSKGREKLLACYHEENGQMRYWLKTAAAIPQGEGISGEAWIDQGREYPGSVFLLERQTPHGVKNVRKNELVEYGDALGFSVLKVDGSNAEYNDIIQSVHYHWENGTFRMSEYRNNDVYYGPVFVSENRLDFFRGEWEFDQSVQGVIERDLRYASFAAMPQTPQAARQKLSVAPELPGDRGTDMAARAIKFTGGKKYPVYTGPGENYLRSGNGKGQVSTNDWIQVFGEEDGWIMIQYDIASDHFRIGWIDAAALPKGAEVTELTWKNRCEAVIGEQDAVLTDDPIQSGAELAVIGAGDHVEWLGTLGDYAYVDCGSMRGFISLDALEN